MPFYTPHLRVAVFVLIGLILISCSTAVVETPPPPTPCPTCPVATPCPDCPPCPTPEPCPVALEAPFEAEWMGSGHADAAAEAFIHWNEEDPALVPETCARCHSGEGYQDFLGVDGSAAGSIEKAAAPSVITCVSCHNTTAQALSTVTFPSGLEVSGLGDEARCMQCHQGRASSVSVDASIATAGLTDMDTVSADLGFTNIHYYAAAASQYGAWAMGGYQYEGKSYDVKFQHVQGVDTCIDCHNSHTLEIQIETCANCHEGVTSVEDLRDVRLYGSRMDYDGDGDLIEGIYYELEGLREMLYTAMQRYTQEVTGSPVGYDSSAYPYFFVDSNSNGTIDADEANRDNAYKGWTGRLARAAYNYQTSLKDPGAFAHGGKYVIQLLYDSIADLNTALGAPVDLTAARRVDAGHFAASEEAFRHWDAEGEVPGTCARCHSADGLPTYLAQGVNVAEETSAGLHCVTCHDPASEGFAPRVVQTVRFPSGAEVDTGNAGSNLCLNCHQGRESGRGLAQTLNGRAEDEVIERQRFVNVHYYMAGATLFGSAVNGAYQYPDKEYAGQLTHVEGVQTCVDCHDAHTLAIDPTTCETCHRTTDLSTIRMSTVDYDGDGDTSEGIAGEINSLHEQVYAAMQAYAADTLNAPIVFANAYPYFFNDLNGNGEADPDELNAGNAFQSWTPRLLRAAYNYQFVDKDPGAFAHNGDYIIQVLQDTLEDLGKAVTIDLTAMSRP